MSWWRSKEPSIGRPEALLIWTPKGNTGDHLIADACEHYLKDRRIDVWRCDGRLEAAAEADDREYLGDLLADFRGMVMFAGGGNIGIYADNEQIRANLLRHLRPWQRCLVFPQSAFAPEPALVHPQVTVWCRDRASEALLRGSGARTALVPDIALYMDDRIPKRPGGSGVFTIKRRPGGDAETIDHGIEAPGAAADLTRERPLDEITAALAPYEYVVSDRLHGGLIALMMRKKTVFLPVGYHKIRSFWETWHPGVPGSAFVDRAEDLPGKMAALLPPSQDLQALFLERADPAFDRFLMGNPASSKD